MTFHVGQKLCCVDDSAWKCSLRNLPNRPVKGRVYTVRGFFGADSIYLEEILNPSDAKWGNGDVGEGSFWTRRFRPIVERKTSIEIFTTMLNPSKQGVDA